MNVCGGFGDADVRIHGLGIWGGGGGAAAGGAGGHAHRSGTRALT